MSLGQPGEVRLGREEGKIPRAHREHQAGRKPFSGDGKHLRLRVEGLPLQLFVVICNTRQHAHVMSKVSPFSNRSYGAIYAFIVRLVLHACSKILPDGTYKHAELASFASESHLENPFGSRVFRQILGSLKQTASIEPGSSSGKCSVIIVPELMRHILRFRALAELSEFQ